jgi:transcription initiation factor IIE alpha subunit
MIARRYVCKNKCKPEVITESMTYVPKCHKCGEYMIEGYDE